MLSGWSFIEASVTVPEIDARVALADQPCSARLISVSLKRKYGPDSFLLF